MNIKNSHRSADAQYSVTAFLPMKGNSQLVPNKNIRLFAGKPLFFHIVETLSSCKSIETVLINTDSPRIAELAKTFSKVRIIQRPRNICGDTVPMNSIIDHDLTFVETEHILQTHATNPLLSPASVERAIDMYFSGLDTYDSLFTVTKRQTRFYRQDGTPVNHNPQELLQTQDLPALYEENSCLYVFSQNGFRAAGNRRIGKTPQMFSLNALEAIDIDEEEDFVLAEFMAMQLKRIKQ